MFWCIRSDEFGMPIEISLSPAGMFANAAFYGCAHGVHLPNGDHTVAEGREIVCAVLDDWFRDYVYGGIAR